jgi:hypothetical protein
MTALPPPVAAGPLAAQGTYPTAILDATNYLRSARAAPESRARDLARGAAASIVVPRPHDG